MTEPKKSHVCLVKYKTDISSPYAKECTPVDYISEVWEIETKTDEDGIEVRNRLLDRKEKEDGHTD